MNQFPVLDLSTIGPHPATTVIEASAGTGKTTAIATATTRALAEGWVTSDQVMLVTFGTRATTELRTRLHACLTSAIARLRAGGRSREALHVLVDGDGSDRAVRTERLETALRDLDRSVITTTHGFCQSMLAQLGVLADHDRAASFSDDLSDLTSQAFEDAFVRSQSARPTGLPVAAARDLARLVVERPEPLRGPDGVAPDRWAIARDVRHWVERRKRVLGVYGFDDMVVRLHQALEAALPEHEVTPGSAAWAARRLISRRFRWVMIDEYQDTDSLQWEVARAAFDGHSRLVLIGDPKQAIYGFRGADVQAYLRAVQDSQDRSTLAVNWRSTHSLVAAVTELFGGHALGRGITLPSVRAHHPDSHLRDRAGQELPLVQLRLVTGSNDAPLPDRAAEQLITTDLVAEVGRLLDSTLAGAPGGPDDSERRIRPDQVTVLVRTNRRGEQVRDALITGGIQAVFSGSGSVFASQAARDWLTLLDAIERPAQASLRRAALTSFFGHDVPSLSRLDDTMVADIAVTISQIGGLLSTTGVAAAFTELCEQREVLARVLATPAGERVVTDLRHVSQLLHDHQRRSGCGVTGLREWLADHVEQHTESDEGTRKLESDRAAVQILTVHRAKGLDLPVVLVAEGATHAVRQPPRGRAVVVHDDHQRGWIDLSPDHAARDAALAAETDEELRLLYVALTRASAVLRVWWAPDETRTPRSALHRLLSTPPMTDRTPPAQVDLAPEPAAALLARWSQGPWNAVHVPEPAAARARSTDPVGASHVSARAFTRRIDRDWRRTSYSALTTGLHDLAAVEVLADEPDGPEPDGPEPGDLTEGPDGGQVTPDQESVPIVSPLAQFPGGVLFGTLVHAVLEDLDPHQQDLGRELQRAAVRALADTPLPGVGVDELAAGLELVVTTPLGDLTGGRSLREHPRSDRLAELDFELPLGDHGSARTVGDLARALTRHLPASDPLADYGQRLAATEAGEQVLAGWLTGSIDAVLRHPTTGGPRHVVVDYKTNRMPLPPGQPLTIQHYSGKAMAEAMMASHYPLQALLYCVALHRHLRHRMPGYDPQRHLGGVGYLFVRGMAGPDREQPRDMPWGVFTWYPPAALVLEASDVLAGVSR